MMDSTVLTEVSTFSSPLDHVLRHVPKSHEKPLRQAVYNVAVTAVFALVGIAAYYVFVVLEAFAIPIFWAVLSGSVLHPYKTRLADLLRNYFSSLASSDRPSSVLALESAFRASDRVLDRVGRTVLASWRVIVLFTVGILAGYYVTAVLYPENLLFYVQSAVFPLVGLVSFLEQLKLAHVCGFVTLHLVALLMFFEPRNARSFRPTGAVCWVLVAGYLLNSVLGPVLLVVAFVTLLSKATSALESKDRQTVTKPLFRRAVFTMLKRLHEEPETDNEDEDEGGEGTFGGSEPPTTSTPSVDDRPKHKGVSALKKPHGLRTTPESSSSGTTPQLFQVLSQMKPRRLNRTIIRRASSQKREREEEEEDSEESSFYLQMVLWACVVLQLWVHPVLLNLLPLPILYSLLKRFFKRFELLEPFKTWLAEDLYRDTVLRWCLERREALVPGCVEGFAREVHRMEKRVVRVLPNYADVIVTLVLILSLIGLFISATVFVTFHLYTESVTIVHLGATVMAKLANSSVYQQLNSTIVGGKENIDFDEVVSSGYLYGRDYISKSLMTSEKESMVELEEKVLVLWDRMYQYWLATYSNASSGPLTGPVVTEEAVASSMEDLFNMASKYAVFSRFASNNMDTLASVLQQGWVVVTENVGLALTMTAELLRVVVTGGSEMVNFVFSIVVYFTALFYMLSSNDSIYKPIEVVADYGQLLGSGFAGALNKAINNVFTVTVKMISFYAMWTYFTHTMFGASIVTYPVITAAFLAAIPVAGQYLVAIPAALELWLAADRWMAALVLIFCHCAPTYIIDSAIYSEVKQGVHPWITGLSIIGGVYWCGAPGAIYGPLLLCAVYVLLSMYTGVLKDIPLETTKVQQSLLVGSTPYAKRSDSLY